jgi:predicted membrane protein
MFVTFSCKYSTTKYSKGTNSIEDEALKFLIWSACGDVIGG